MRLAAISIASLEAELASARAEQKRLAKAVALSDVVPELVVELHQRSARIQNLEAQRVDLSVRHHEVRCGGDELRPR